MKYRNKQNGGIVYTSVKLDESMWAPLVDKPKPTRKKAATAKKTAE